jgi:hypothetical protein
MWSALLPCQRQTIKRRLFRCQALQRVVAASVSGIALRVVGALTFPFCNRFDLNRRARSARPKAEAAVATMGIDDETLLV